MGCKQSKVSEPKIPDKCDIEKQKSNQEGTHVFNKGKSIISHKDMRNNLEVKPPPVKAVPKVTPKAFPKREN
ncbi:conserved Plasmodium protein, unknown function [Plasmodium malariae]|uniref:Uncharacterized protein n=1 Tax=Plasmodium malariae TaxID=5858 RepID=A0A1C3KBK9_PLAMA|nr:conserved Plasmodium protein, unknown function [Plasmodium malariae]